MLVFVENTFPYSRKIWVRPLHRKTAQEVLSQMKNIFEETGKFEILHTGRIFYSNFPPFARGCENKNKKSELEFCAQKFEYF